MTLLVGLSDRKVVPRMTYNVWSVTSSPAILYRFQHPVYVKVLCSMLWKCSR